MMARRHDRTVLDHPNRTRSRPMTITLDVTEPDLDAAVAAQMMLVAEHLFDIANVRPGWRVLNVADGSTLPFPAASFDAVTSVFGCMFAPDHARTAAELLRVCRPGGAIALASWTPDSFIGDVLRTAGAHVPSPAGVPSPTLWGTQDHLLKLLGRDIVWLDFAERTFTWEFPSAEELVAFLRRSFAPTLNAFAALEGNARGALERDLVALAHRRSLLGGDAIAIPATYAEVVAIRR
jgi:SAM-dependent methyltransferase